MLNGVGSLLGVERRGAECTFVHKHRGVAEQRRKGTQHNAQKGRMAEWSCRGLQILQYRFDSGSGLHLCVSI